MAEPMLQVAGLGVHLGGRAILTDIDLEVSSGGFTALMGPNGSGKTTLLRAIAGAVELSAGTVRVGGADLSTLDDRRRARRIAVLRQEAHLDFEFTVEEVVLMGRSPYKTLLQADGDDDRAIVADALKLTDAAALAPRTFTTLSGGEKQRVLLARALAQQPELLLLDEPTNHLDVRHQLDILERVAGLGITVLAALHDINLAMRFAQQCVLLAEGRRRAAGEIHDTLTPESIEQVFGVRAERLQTEAGQSLFALGRCTPV